MREHRYLVNFLRDRDAYVLPAALAAEGMLAGLVTDVYADSFPRWALKFMPGNLSTHRSELISGNLVTSCLSAAVVQFVGDRILRRKYDSSFVADRLLARKTAKRWQRNPTDLLLYSLYAAEALRAASTSKVQRLVFLYHPHYKLVRRLLEEDAENFPEMSASLRVDREMTSVWRDKFADEELTLAQGFITASTFSAKSLKFAGCEKPSIVVPYFKGPNSLNVVHKRLSTRPRFLFVGQGIQRKGLHHLFLAWHKANLSDADLVCVCSRLDPAIAKMAPPGVILKSKITSEELQIEFSNAHVFVLPSIIEGFGLVYLEALSRGAHIIYTDNTGVPDLNISSEAGTLVPCGDIEKLAAELTRCAQVSRGGGFDVELVAASVGDYGFSEYALRLKMACETLIDPLRSPGVPLPLALQV